MAFFQKLYAVTAFSLLGMNAAFAALPKHDFREQITTLVDEFHNTATNETELHDKFFVEIFREAVPADAAIIRLDEGNSKELCDFVKATAIDMGIPTPRLYLSTDDIHVDAKFATHNNIAGILLHSRLFSTLNTLNLKHYLRNSVLKRLQAVHREHNLAVDKRETKNVLTAAIPAALIALMLAWLYSGRNNPMKEAAGENVLGSKGQMVLGLGAAIIAAGGAARFMTLLKRTLSTHAYEQVSSEDVFPGPSEGRVEATFDAQPEHLLAAMLRIKQRIAEENKKDAKLRRLELEEEEELARKMEN
ncbi:MAG: hypothetical protein PVJ92_00060 [Candidatus Dependentiae bacterium]|jgi:hypothetical protein